tara:strand:- start:440 stop:1060 length:621 start_codon:yes stop_codon:yes gene_type:complete
MFNFLKNTGIIKEKLNDKAMKKLKSYIKNKKHNMSKILAGNINNSFNIEDKDNWFFNNVLLTLINQYSTKDFEAIVPSILTKNCAYNLDSFWVNFQNKYEFNPVHSHTGVFSFVVWIEIPSSYKKEKELKFVKESNSPCPNTFEFIFSNILGAVCTERFHLEPEDKGTILLFPAKLLHQVYPFYLSNKHRISISGNIALDPTQLIK